MSKIASINGTIVLTDGTTSNFQISTDGQWQQWGATTERLGQTVDAMDAMVRGLLEDNLLASDDDEMEAHDRLEYLRGEIRVERISYGEIADWQDLADYIEPGDYELLAWVTDHEEEK